MGKFTFRKEERLSRKKWIEALFAEGASFLVFPLRVLCLPHPDESHPCTQVLFSVPHRIFPRAVDRNAIKRKLREAYRLHKHQLDHAGKKWLIAYIYVAKDLLPASTFQEKIPITLKQIPVEKKKKH